MLPGPTRDASIITASDNVPCGTINSDQNNPSRSKSDGTQIGFEHKGLPQRMDPTHLTELEEGQTHPNKTHQSNLSSAAVHLRIAALEKSQVELLERVAALESFISHMNSDSTGQKASVTFSPWRVLNSVLVLGAGGYKAVASLQGETAGPTAVDWIVGVLWSLIAYWVSFLDDLNRGYSNWFFDHDMSAVVFIVLQDLVASGLFVGIMVIALITILQYETPGLLPFTVVWCAATAGIGLLFLIQLAMRWILSTWRNIGLSEIPQGYASSGYSS
ncbi:hypothetical protein B0H19DRAFT_1273834 [Mycena capillaripes]|nr:hypothetical protein B0H19DRAFT_1273834 [Mycena capillaripes]